MGLSRGPQELPHTTSSACVHNVTSPQRLTYSRSLSYRLNMRAAILSAGAWSAAAHIPAFQAMPGVNLVAVTSPDFNKATRMQREFGFSHAFADYRDALAEGPDVVVVNSPPAFHRDMVIDSLESGADVLCEKPFAVNLDDARAMASVARRTGRNLLSGFGWVHMPMLSEGARLVEEDDLGEVEYLSVELTVNIRELLVQGKPYTESTEAYLPEAGTYTDPTVSGGGAAAVSTTHAFAVLLALSPAPVQSVFARTVLSANGLDLHDVVSMKLVNGATALVTCTSVHESNEAVGWRVEVCGSEGSIWIDSSTERWVHRRRDGSSAAVHLPPGFSSYDAGAPTRTLVEARIQGAVHPHNNVDVAERTTELMVATYMSADQRKEVSLSSLL